MKALLTAIFQVVAMIALFIAGTLVAGFFL